MYTNLITNNNDQKTYDAAQQNLIYASLLMLSSQEVNNCKHQIIELYTQLHNMFKTLNQSKHSHTKCRIIHSLFNFLFGTTSSTDEINAIMNNMEIVKGNQDTLSNQIRQTFKFVNLTNTESNMNRLLLNALLKDIVQINTTVHHLSKELKALILDTNIFVNMFQLRSHLATLHNGLNSLRISILSIINHISVINSQKLAPVLLSPLDLTSLLIKLETKLLCHTPG